MIRSESALNKYGNRPILKGLTYKIVIQKTSFDFFSHVAKGWDRALNIIL